MRADINRQIQDLFTVENSRKVIHVMCINIDVYIHLKKHVKYIDKESTATIHKTNVK